MKIAIACGGTGGHVFPGLATARVLQALGHEVTMWTTGRPVESEALARWQGKIVAVPARGLTGISGLRRRVGAALQLMEACLRSWRLMRRDPPDRILAMGSYASVGPAVAGRWLRIPLVLHEANAIPGRAVRLLSRWAAAVGMTFPSTASVLRHPRIVLTGLPVRPEMTQPLRRRPTGAPFTVLIMGGSQGARRLNELASEALIRLASRGGKLSVVHLSGRADAAWVRQRYAEAGLDAVVHGFLQDMTEAYDAADLAISRAGAGACMELALRRVPALLVPFPASPNGDQTANARAVEAAGGADVILQEALTGERLAQYVETCRQNPDKLRRMREALAGLAIPDAAERLAALTLDPAGVMKRP